MFKNVQVAVSSEENKGSQIENACWFIMKKDDSDRWEVIREAYDSSP